MSYRHVPPDWYEFTDTFIEDVKIGVRAGWQYLPEFDGTEALVHTPEGATPRAYAVRRNRILGSPIPVVMRSD